MSSWLFSCEGVTTVTVGSRGTERSSADTVSTAAVEPCCGWKGKGGGRRGGKEEGGEGRRKEGREERKEGREEREERGREEGGQEGRRGWRLAG